MMKVRIARVGSIDDARSGDAHNTHSNALQDVAEGDATAVARPAAIPEVVTF
jgi:hypothetical protein